MIFMGPFQLKTFCISLSLMVLYSLQCCICKAYTRNSIYFHEEVKCQRGEGHGVKVCVYLYTL